MILGLHLHMRVAREYCNDGCACVWAAGDILTGAWMARGCADAFVLVEQGGDLADKGGRETGKCSEGTSACCKVVAQKSTRRVPKDAPNREINRLIETQNSFQK